MCWFTGEEAAVRLGQGAAASRAEAAHPSTDTALVMPGLHPGGTAVAADHLTALEGPQHPGIAIEMTMPGGHLPNARKAFSDAPLIALRGPPVTQTAIAAPPGTGVFSAKKTEKRKSASLRQRGKSKLYSLQDSGRLSSSLKGVKEAHQTGCCKASRVVEHFFKTLLKSSAAIAAPSLDPPKSPHQPLSKKIKSAGSYCEAGLRSKRA